MNLNSGDFVKVLDKDDPLVLSVRKPGKQNEDFKKRWEDYQAFLYAVGEASKKYNMTVISIREGGGTSEKGGIWEMKFIHKDQLPVMDVTSYCCASQPYGVPEVFKGLS